MITDIGAISALTNRRQNKAMELLMGMVTGMVADQQLHDMEIRFLNTWLTEHQEVTTVWPGCVIAESVKEVLADGIITDEERTHLLQTLQAMAVTDFSSTGSSTAEVMQLPIKDESDVDVRERHICLTGEFQFGTRSKCEQLTHAAGGLTVNTVTRKVAYLVVGTNVSPNWLHTSYGRKIQQAVTMQQDGHPICIISERRWLEVLSVT
jgi:NAD-dependent DNA ligase